MDLGNKICKIRKDNNLTQEEFAEKYNVTRQTVSSWENCKSYPDLDTLVRISDDFSISLDVLLKEDKKVIKDIDKNVKNNKRNKKVIIVLSFIIIALIIIFGIIYKLSLFGFNNKKSDAKGSLYITCSLKDNKYFYNVSYGDDYRILSIDGDEYIINNVDIERATNAKEVINTVTDYFESHNGSCE